MATELRASFCFFFDAPDSVYCDVAMATHPVPDRYYAGMVTPVFDPEQTLSTS